MWRQSGTRPWSCTSASTNYMKSHASGLKPPNTAITCHTLQHRMCGPWSSLSWRFYVHSGTGPCGGRNLIPLLCITTSLSTLTCSITGMSWCELWPRRRYNGKKTYTLSWSLLGRAVEILYWSDSNDCDVSDFGTYPWCIPEVAIVLVVGHWHAYESCRRDFLYFLIRGGCS
jgi:hypothetical protein